MTTQSPLSQRPELSNEAFQALWETFQDRFPSDARKEVAREFAEAVADALTPPLAPLLCREPAYYRYRHSEQEKWHYGPQPLNWWECQPLYTVSHSPETDASINEVLLKLRRLGERVLEDAEEPVTTDEVIDLCHDTGVLLARGALPFASGAETPDSCAEDDFASPDQLPAKNATSEPAPLSKVLDRLGWSLLLVLQDVYLLNGKFDEECLRILDEVRVALRKLGAELNGLETHWITGKASAEWRHGALSMWAAGYREGKEDSHVQFGQWFSQTTKGDWGAFRRFYDCVEDGEGYDVPDTAMARLADLGLVRKVRGTVYEFTQLGLAMQSYDPYQQFDTPKSSKSTQATKGVTS